MERTVLILGAGSDIGGEIARLLAPGSHFLLAARRPERLGDLEADLRERGALSLRQFRFEATDFASLDATITEAFASAPAPISHVVLSFGVLGDQQRAEVDPAHAVEIATVDYTAQLAALTRVTECARRGGHPTCVVAFSSIAGWRARRANYVYGSTKAGLDAFCQGLSDALHGSNIQLITARPGFVIGSMTAGMKPAPLSVTPDVVAEEVVKAMEPGGRSVTLWIPKPLRLLAWVMRIVPRPVWRRMPR